SLRANKILACADRGRSRRHGRQPKWRNQIDPAAERFALHPRAVSDEGKTAHRESERGHDNGHTGHGRQVFKTDTGRSHFQTLVALRIICRIVLKAIVSITIASPEMKLPRGSLTRGARYPGCAIRRAAITRNGIAPRI